MKTNLFQLSLGFLMLISITSHIFSQQLICKKDALSALHPIPKLKYQCSGDSNDYDEKILTKKNRLDAINSYIKSLESFTFTNWWRTSVNDLILCDFRKKAGKFSSEEKAQFKNGEFPIDLFGNAQIRIIRVSDPCYQTGFGGSNIFLLHRKDGKIYVSEIIDGYFSRADAIFAGFAKNENEQIVEVATSSGGLNPTVTNYYFTIDKKTNRAVPKNLFLDKNKKPTNQITSKMNMEDDLKQADPLHIIEKERLAKNFYVLTENYDNGKFNKQILRWNGKIYK